MRKTKSAILETLYSTAKGLHGAGVMDQITLGEFDRMCVPPIKPLAPAQITKNSRNIARQPSGLCRTAKHQRLDGTKMGDRPEEAHRHRAQATASGAETRSRSRRLKSACLYAIRLCSVQ